MNFIYIVIWLTVLSPNSNVYIDDLVYRPFESRREKAEVSSFTTKVYDSVDSIKNLLCYKYGISDNVPYKIYRQKGNDLQEMVVKEFYDFKNDTTFMRDDSGKFVYKSHTENKTITGYKMFPLNGELETTIFWNITKLNIDTLYLKPVRFDSCRVITCDTLKFSHNNNWVVDTLFCKEIVKKKAKKVKKK